MSEAAAPITTCPRCGQGDVSGPVCPRCGVLVAKARDRRARPRTPAVEERPRTSALHWLFLLGVLAAGGTLALLAARGPAPAAKVSPPGDAAPADAPATLAAEFPPPPPPAVSIATPVEVEAPPPAPGLPAADHEKASQLAGRVRAGARLASADIEAAEDLFSRYPDEASFRDLLEAALLTSARQEHSRREYPQAAAHLQRAASVRPDSTRPRLGLLRVAEDMKDWTAAEAAARSVLQLDPGDTTAHYSLAYALLRQDRNREAAEVVKAALEIKEDSNLRALLERIQKTTADERGMIDQHLSHFNVRYDGGAHEDVGREILRALERHYATLARVLDYQPTTTIPVILFTREGYYNANGAPAWSGGNYDNTDGRIRIPIGGLTSSLTPDMEGTLIHELTHAFVAERSRGVCPSLVHEGIAQYMEGKRLDTELTPQVAAAVADQRIGRVYAFYLGALSFVEYLIANRGMGGMNDLIGAMGETGNVDEAFRRVHGQTYREALKGWQERISRRYGS